MAKSRVSFSPVRISKRSTTSAGGMPSGMATSAVAGAAKPLAAPNVIASHSTTGSASYPIVPAGLRMSVKGVPALGARTPLAFRFMGALI